MNDAGLKTRNPVLAPILMVVNGVSLYAGAALAVGLFESFPPALVAWMRVAAAAVILLVLYRPAVRNFIGQTGFYAAVYGVSTLAMNITFYEAIARIPMWKPSSSTDSTTPRSCTPGTGTTRRWVPSVPICRSGGPAAGYPTARTGPPEPLHGSLLAERRV